MYNGVWRSRGYLPHFDKTGALQVVTFRLIDSLPIELLRKIKARIPEKQLTLRKQVIEAQLDAGYGQCRLKDPGCAGIVQESLLHFDGDRYRLLAWVVMPNHVHAVFEVNEEYPLPKLMKNLKGYTALMINRRLGRQGSFWQREYFDRAVRDETHFRNAVEYIHHNPVKAKLVNKPDEWAFSSAGDKNFVKRQQEVLAGNSKQEIAG